jgi:hypothetical protein
MHHLSKSISVVHYHAGFRHVCDIAAPDSSMLVCKHQVAQLIAMKTRGQLTMKAIPDQPIVHARAGVKPPSDIPREDYNDYMTDLTCAVSRVRH